MLLFLIFCTIYSVNAWNFLSGENGSKMFTENNQKLIELTEDIEDLDIYDPIPKILIPEMGNSQAIVYSSTEFSPTTKSTHKIVQEIKNALDTFWFQSIIVLVDDSEDVIQDAKTYMQQIINLYHDFPVFSLLKFNSTDVSSILANSSNKKYFLSSLDFAKSAHWKTVGVLETDRGSVLFSSILKSVRMLPKTNGIFVFTNRETQDEDLAQLTWKELFENEIKLYLIWSGLYPTIKGEEKLLKKTASFSGGKFFVSNREQNLSKLYNSAFIKNAEALLPKSLVALKVNITTKENLQFPIDSSVRGIHISVTSPVATMELISPDGFVLNLLNDTAVEHFSQGSFVISQLGQRDIQLNTVGHLPTSISGIWRFGIDASGLNPQGCNVTVSVQTHLNVMASVAEQLAGTAPEKLEKVVKITVPNEFSNISKIKLYNKWGAPMERNISFKTPPFQTQKLTENIKDVQFNNNSKFNVEFDHIPSESFYVKIDGKDQEGNSFQRISYLEREKVPFVLKPLTIEVGADSELIVHPNQPSNIYFEVTNNRDQVVSVNFKCEDEKSMLLQMQPRYSWLNPMQTAVVTVQTRAPSDITSDYRNLVTFTALGPDSVQKSVQMYITNTIIHDNEEPYLWHRFTSDCNDVLLGDCRDRTWAIEITAQDKESGLLQLSTSPKGVYFPYDYIPGTKESVVGIYGGSCCQSKIQLTAVDLLNNRRTYAVNAYHAALSAGSISAIVLGIFAFIVIIILIVLVSRKMCFKKTRSVDLPVYSSPHGNTRDR